MQEQKKQHKNNEGTNTPVDSGGFSFTFLFLFIYLFIYFLKNFYFIYLRTVFIYLFWALHCCEGFSLVAVCRGILSSCSGWASYCCGFSCCGALGLQGTQASVVLAYRLSCSVACGIFPNQGLNLCLLQWWVGSLPLSHQEAPKVGQS